MRIVCGVTSLGGGVMIPAPADEANTAVANATDEIASVITREKRRTVAVLPGPRTRFGRG